MHLEAFNDCELFDSDRPELNRKLFRVPSGEGFNFDYMLFIPNNIGNEVTLIVEGANVPYTCKTIEEANDLIFSKGRRPGMQTYGIAKELGLPVLFPLFPRICETDRENFTIDNHMLSTNSLCNSTKGLVENGLERVDLQLIEMFKDASRRLTEMGISVDPKFIIDGFSASSKFANRFTILHPEYVRLCIGGGVSGALTLPVKQIGDKTLKWPVGVGNLEELGIDLSPEQLEAFLKVPQFYYEGELDNNDPFIFNESGEAAYGGLINTDELIQLYEVFGSTSMYDRWIRAQELYRALDINVDFMTYQEYGHTPEPAYDDVKSKISQVLELDSKEKSIRK